MVSNIALSKENSSYIPDSTLDQAVMLAGELSAFSFVDVIQMIANARKSGYLCIQDQERCVHLSFSKGELVEAEAGNVQGEDAFFSLLEIKEGRFEFRAGIPQKTTLFRANMTWLLLEALRRNDEACKIGSLPFEESPLLPAGAQEHE